MWTAEFELREKKTIQPTRNGEKWFTVFLSLPHRKPLPSTQSYTSDGNFVAVMVFSLDFISVLRCECNTFRFHSLKVNRKSSEPTRNHADTMCVEVHHCVDHFRRFKNTLELLLWQSNGENNVLIKKKVRNEIGNIFSKNVCMEKKPEATISRWHFELCWNWNSTFYLSGKMRIALPKCKRHAQHRMTVSVVIVVSVGLVVLWECQAVENGEMKHFIRWRMSRICTDKCYCSVQWNEDRVREGAIERER